MSDSRLIPALGNAQFMCLGNWTLGAVELRGGLVIRGKLIPRATHRSLKADSSFTALMGFTAHS